MPELDASLAAAVFYLDNQIFQVCVINAELLPGVLSY